MKNSLLLSIISLVTAFSSDPMLHQVGDNVKLSVSNLHEMCDHWASNDGECLNNPRYMWSHCLSSCLKYAKDDNPECQTWANEGY